MSSIQMLPRLTGLEIFSVAGKLLIVARGEVPGRDFNPVLLMGTCYPDGKPDDGVWRYALVGGPPAIGIKGGPASVAAYHIGPDIATAKKVRVQALENELEVDVHNDLKAAAADTVAAAYENLRELSFGPRFTSD